MKIHAGTGQSRAQNAMEAGREAAARALFSLSGEKPSLVIVFTTPQYELSALLSGIRSVTFDTPLVGATSCGEIVAGEYLGVGAGVAVLALTSGEYRFGLASANHIRGGLDAAGQALARQSRAEAGQDAHGLVVLLADCLLGDLQQLVQGIYRITGPKIPIIGGAASDEQKFIATFVFHNDQIIEQGAACVWISSQRPLTVATRHGWQPLGAPMLVTRARDFTIHNIGGRPAATVYEEQLGLAPGELSLHEFWQVSLYHPLGMLQPDGSFVIRVAREKNEEGALRILGSCPPSGSSVQVMRGSTDSLLDVVEDLVSTTLRANPQTGLVLVFSCSARATIFKERAKEEARRLQEAAGEVPTFGVYCCGEFSRTVSVLGTHNATITAVAL